MRGSEYYELTAFVAVADHGNFARAAKHLRIAPSSLSQTIKKLEQRLGVELLLRTTRSVSMTSPGFRLYQRFKPAVAEIEAAIAEVDDPGASPAGLVRMHMPRAAYALLLDGRLGDLRRRYPDIHVDIVVDDALVNLARSGFDLDVRLSAMLDASVSVVATCSTARHVAIASPAYLAEHGTPKTPAELTGHRCIQWRRPDTDTPYRWAFQVDDCSVMVDVVGPLTVSHCDVAVAAAVDAVGIAFVHEVHARSALATGTVIPVLAPFLPPFPGWSICHPRAVRPSSAAQVLARYMSSADESERSDALIGR